MTNGLVFAGTRNGRHLARCPRCWHICRIDHIDRHVDTCKETTPRTAPIRRGERKSACPKCYAEMTSKAIRNHISKCKKVAQPRPAYVDVSESACVPAGRYVACGSRIGTEKYRLESDVKTAMSVDGHLGNCCYGPSLEFVLCPDKDDYVLIGKHYTKEALVDAFWVW